MKKHVAIYLVSFIFLTGCMSTSKTSDGRTVFNLTPEQIFEAKVAFCSSDIPYSNITKFTTIDRTTSPEVRKRRKDAVWEDWQNKVSEAQILVSDKLYRVELTVLFDKYEDEKNRMRMVPGRVTKRTEFRSTKIDAAVPSRFIYNSIRSDFLPSIYPLDAHFSPLNLGMAQQWVIDNYSNPATADKGTYVFNNVRQIRHGQSSFKFSTGEYGGYNGGVHGNWQLGVMVDTSNWTTKEGSPISLKNGDAYLNLSGFDFIDAFGVYPDTGSVSVNIEYLFTIEDCNNKYPLGQLKEVLITAISPMQRQFSSNKQIAHIVL